MAKTKSKWNSQQIQKHFKNKHHNDTQNIFCNKSNHSTLFVKECNAFKKNIYTNYDNEYEDELFIEECTSLYWTCSVCTYKNIERDMKCLICSSPFKSLSNTNEYISDTLTFGDYLPPILDSLVNFEDDFDELTQFAILSSFDDYIPLTNSNNHSYAKSHITKPNKTQIERDRIKLQKQKENIQKMKALRIEKEKERKQRIKKQNERKILKKYTKECPKLDSVLDEKTNEFIQNNMNKIYFNKSFLIKLILNVKVLQKFMSDKNASNKKWEFVYHGTESQNNEGIIKNGLIIGGTKGVRIRNGSAYGRGIYCSPNCQTAKSYEKGSMFVCIVRDVQIKKCGTIWIVQKESDILPLYLISIGTNNGKPKWPYFKISASLLNILNQKNDHDNVMKKNDNLSQKILKFVPSFNLLNERDGIKRKIKRKWSAYYKINRFCD